MGTTRSPRRDKGSGNGSAVWTQLADGTGYYCARLKMPDGRRAKQQLRYKGALLTDRERDRPRAVELTARLAERCRATPAAEAPPAVLSSRPTVRQFGEDWTSGRLFARHGEVNKLGDKATADTDRKRLEADVYSFKAADMPLALGDMAVADVTDVDIEKCFAAAAHRAHARRGKPWRKATKFQLYQATKRLFDLAIMPGRLRTDNPVSPMLKPGKDKPLLYVFLYPSELLALLGCRDIPLGRRVLYVLGCYCGLRKSSLVPLVWDWVDFQHGMLTALVNKTFVPQVFEVRADVMTVLQRWYEHCGSPKGSEPVICDLGGPKGRDAETLRDDLRLVGVKRALLFSDAPNVQPLRFHDTRATFVTWAKRAGKGDGWISDRTGHLTPAMLDRYTRAARQLADLQYEPFPDLTDAIPEFVEAARNVVHLRRPTGA
jgi:integrase